MSEVQKSGPYEILLRFNCEPGEDFGHLRGVSLAQKAYLVDDKTGKITGAIHRSGADDPKNFPVAEVEKYLGKQFTQFQKQLEAATQEAARLTEENVRLSTNGEQLQATVDKLSTEGAGLRRKVDLLQAGVDRVQKLHTGFAADLVGMLNESRGG